MSNGHAKGSRFERQAAVRLSLWISRSGSPSTELLWRSPGSGSRATNSQKRGGEQLAAHAGDISATHKDGHLLCKLFHIECKSYNTFDLERMAFGRSGTFLVHWIATRHASRHFNRMPFFFLKATRRGEMIVTDRRGAALFQSACRLNRNLRSIVTFPRVEAVCFLAREVFGAVDFDVVRRFHE